MSLEEGSRRKDGQIETCPLLGWEVAQFHIAGLLRLNFARSENQLKTGGEFLQIAAGGPQLRDLAHALSRLADRLDQSPKGTAQ